MGKQRQGKKGRRLPLRAAATSSSRSTKSTHTQQSVNTQQPKGINFAGDKINQSNSQAIILDIIRKWRQSEPKRSNGEPLRGSCRVLVKAQQKLHGCWLTENQVKMKWRNMTNKEKEQINMGFLPSPPPNKPPPPRPATLPPRTAGRPFGSTNQAKRIIADNNVRMKNTITDMYLKNQQLPAKQKKTLVDIITEQQAVFKSDLPVHVNTIYSRVERNRTHVTQTGQTSPAIALDARLIQIIHEYYEMNLELARTEIIAFANSHLRGSKLEQHIITWKLIHVPSYKSMHNGNVRPTHTTLGISWFNNFVKRNNQYISYTIANNVAWNRAEHCTWDKFNDMYDKVYRLLEQHGYAESMVVPSHYNKLGKMCDKDDVDAFGDIVKLAFLRPDLIFVADECGTNTNMSRDKMSSNNKRVTKKGCKVKIPSCSSDVHFTTLGITALTGIPVFAVLIIAKASQLSYGEIFGFDPNAKWIGDVDIFIQLKNGVPMVDLILDSTILGQNTGVGKVFPGGPVCHFKGVDIPTLVCRSDSGGITPTILVGILRHYDKYVPRVAGDPCPACILDGHGSRLSPEVGDYMQNRDRYNNIDPTADHAWHLYLGLPNGTAYWQVGDSSYQNGRYKNLGRKIKEMMRDEQRRNFEPIKIGLTDIVPILAKAWPDCYGDIHGNVKAILERGWGPLNRGVLHHPDILRTKKKIESSSTNSNITNNINPSIIDESTTNNDLLDDANVSSGAAYSVLSTLATAKRRDRGRERQFEQELATNRQHRKDNKEKEKALSGVIRLTAGSLYAAQCVDVSCEEVQNEVNRRHHKRIATETTRLSTKYDVDIKRYNDGKSLLKKAEMHNIAIVHELLGVTDEKERKNIINRLKRQKKWLLNDDYLALIRYKQLSMAVKPAIATTLAPRTRQWETRYEAMVHPSVPIPPPNYVSAIADGGEEDVDDEVVSLSVITANLDMLASVPMTSFHSETNEYTDDMAAADILLNIQSQAV